MISPANIQTFSDDELSSLVNLLSATSTNLPTTLETLSREDKIKRINEAAAHNHLPDKLHEALTFNGANAISAMIDACNYHQKSDIYEHCDDQALAITLAINYPQIFKTAKTIYATLTTHKWDFFTLNSPLKIRRNCQRSQQSFGEALRDIASQQGFGKNHVINVVKQGKLLLVHVAYPGYLLRQPEINNDNQLTSSPHRKVFSVTLQYNDQAGLLQIHASSNHKAFLSKLRDAFGQSFFVKPDNAVWTSGRVINLLPLCNDAFERQLTNVTEGINRAVITGITFSPRANIKERTAQRLSHTGLYEWMRRHHFSPIRHVITEVTFKFYFDGLGRPLNATLKTSNDSIEINDNGYREKIIKAQLREWLLLNDQS